MPASPVTKIVRSPAQGFTLVELLVSLVVLSLLVVLLAGTFSQVSGAWLRGQGNAERQRGARALADYVGVELKGAMLPIERVTDSTSLGGNLHLLINPPAAQVPDRFRNADAIFWQAPLATETSFGDLAEVGYFVQWDETNPSSPRPVLSRFFVNPSLAQAPPPGGATNGSEAAMMIRNPLFLIYDTDSRKWLSEGIIDEVAPATRQSGYRGLFAENVLGLWVRAYGVDGNELPRSFDSRTGYPAGAPKHFLPGRVQISFAQIDSHHAPRLDPVWKEVQGLSRQPKLRDASAFLDALRDRAGSNGALESILPGIRTYVTEVQLENAR